MTNQCEHGQLARVCALCEKDAEIARLRERISVLETACLGLTEDLRDIYVEVKQKDARIAELEAAFLCLRDEWHTSHYLHFDAQGTAGANCPACILDRKASKIIYAMCEGITS